ncbi:hypothetical protein BKA58DRAFT_403005 [Alternaria rosae]|uniref:uncharacterized protein n=1 Tax=Alternaria rosae TaxID=1187941 RepID=UPI001E8D5F6B|nr:uncharacterized protein BKA58DRAFT_403005 [Alternaria rosae]KAH6868659.1 hypothetical protein BKA58DRAFT_403005 [Alternaria rosae]
MCHTKPCLHAAILSWHLCSLLHREMLAAVQLGSLFGVQSGASLCNGMRKELRAHGVGKFSFAPALAQAAPSPTTCQASSRSFCFSPARHELRRIDASQSHALSCPTS